MTKTDNGHRYFFGSNPEMPWRNKMTGATLLKMFNQIMQDVQKGDLDEVDWAEVEDFREALLGVDEEISSLRQMLNETTDLLADVEVGMEEDDTGSDDDDLDE